MARRSFRLCLLAVAVCASASAQSESSAALIERLTGPSSRLEKDLRVLTDEIGERLSEALKGLKSRAGAPPKQSDRDFIEAVLHLARSADGEDVLLAVERAVQVSIGKQRANRARLQVTLEIAYVAQVRSFREIMQRNHAGDRRSECRRNLRVLYVGEMLFAIYFKLVNLGVEGIANLARVSTEFDRRSSRGNFCHRKALPGQPIGNRLQVGIRRTAETSTNEIDELVKPEHL